MDDSAATGPAENGAGHNSITEEKLAAAVRSKLRIQLTPRGNLNLKRLSEKTPLKTGDGKSAYNNSETSAPKNAGFKSARAASKMARISIGKILRSFLASVEALATDQEDFKADQEAEEPSDTIQFAGYLAAVKAAIDAEPNTDFNLDKVDAARFSVTIEGERASPSVSTENDAKGVESEKLVESGSRSETGDDVSARSDHEVELDATGFVEKPDTVQQNDENEVVKELLNGESLSDDEKEKDTSAVPKAIRRGRPRKTEIFVEQTHLEVACEEGTHEATDTIGAKLVDSDQRDEGQQLPLEEVRIPALRGRGRPRKSELVLTTGAELPRSNLPHTKKERHDDLSVSESELIGLDAETPGPRRGPPRKSETVEMSGEETVRHRQSATQEKVEKKRRGRPPKKSSIGKTRWEKSAGFLKERKYGRSGKAKESYDATNDAALEDIRAIEELSAAAREEMENEIQRSKQAFPEKEKPRRGRPPKKKKSTTLPEIQVADEIATTTHSARQQIPELTRDFLSSDSQITVESDATQEIYVTSIGKHYEGLDYDTTVDERGEEPEVVVRTVKRGRPRKGENRHDKRPDINLIEGEGAFRRGRSFKLSTDDQAPSSASHGISEYNNIQLANEPFLNRKDGSEGATLRTTPGKRGRPKKFTAENDVDRLRKAEEQMESANPELVKRNIGRPRKTTKESQIENRVVKKRGRPSKISLGVFLGGLSDTEPEDDNAVALYEPAQPKKRGRPPKKRLESSVRNSTEVTSDREPSLAKPKAPKRRGRRPGKNGNALAVNKNKTNEDAEYMSLPEAIAPKKRGRPPKKSLQTLQDERLPSSKAASEDAKDVPLINTEIPKWLDRPPKHAIAASISLGVLASTSNEEEPRVSTEGQPKRRGRPPKNKQSVMDRATIESAGSDVDVPKRRGRSSMAGKPDVTFSPSKDESGTAFSDTTGKGNVANGTSLTDDSAVTDNEKETITPRRRGRPPLTEEQKQARLAQKLAPKGRGKKNVLKVSLPVPIRPRSEREADDKRNDESTIEAAGFSQKDGLEEGSVSTILESPAGGSPLRTGIRSADGSLAGSPPLLEAGSGSPKRILDTRVPESQTRKVTVKVVTKKQPIRVSRGSDTDTAEETLDEEEHLRQLEQKLSSAPPTPLGASPPRTQQIAVSIGSPRQAAQDSGDEPQSKKQKMDDRSIPKVPLFEAPTIMQGKRERKRKVMDDFEDSSDLFARGAITSKANDAVTESEAPLDEAGPAFNKKPDVIVVTRPTVMSPPASASGLARPFAIAQKAPTPTVNVVVPSMVAPPIVVQPTSSSSNVTSQPLQVQIPTSQVTMSLPVQVQTSTSGTTRPVVITVPANGLRSPMGSGIMKTIVMNKVVHRPLVSTPGQPGNIRLAGAAVQANVSTTGLAGKTGTPRVQVVTARPPSVKMFPCAVRPTGLTAGSTSSSVTPDTVVMRTSSITGSSTTSVPRVVTAAIRPSIIRGPRIITSISRPGAPRLLAPTGSTAQGQARLITMRPTISQAGSVQTLRQGTVTMLPTGGKLVVRTVSPSGSLVPPRPVVQQRQITVQATPSPPPPTTIVFTPGANAAKSSTPILVTRSPTIFTRPLATTVRSIGPPKFAQPQAQKPALEKLLPSSTTTSTSNTATVAADQHPAVQQLVTVHRKQPIQAQLPKATVERKQPPPKKPLVQQMRKPVSAKILASPTVSVPVVSVAPIQSKAVDEATSAVEKLLQEPELPQPKLSKKPLTKKQKSMRKTDLIKTSTRSRRRGTDLQIDYNEDRMGAIAGADSETDSQEESPPSEELGSPDQPDDGESGVGQAPQDDIPVAVVEVFLSQNEVKLREVHSPTKQDLADISNQQQQQQQAQQQPTDGTSQTQAAEDHSVQPHHPQQATSTITGGQDAPEGFFTTEEGFVTGEVPTMLETIASANMATGGPSKVACGGLISSNDNAFAKALMSSDEALMARKKSVTNFASGASSSSGSSSKRKSNPMSRD
ncbi:uncharacterized protein LOC111249152 isoform X2 [Varroa destructor]|uniref:Uncharacterized protein n=1 Tax=Varroa destructor TaxID=109461 RepID=A0A7M7JX64_VARDE|nr:uncharacterized protein LOC111249152 isoform X2 [Varroa destructor]